MAFETVGVSTLFLTHLTVPAELLQTFGLHLVGQPLGRSGLGLFAHLGDVYEGLDKLNIVLTFSQSFDVFPRFVILIVDQLLF